MFYLDNRGRGVLVRSKTKRGRMVWFAARYTRELSGARRLRRRELPYRETEIAAWADLATYAKRKGWQPIAAKKNISAGTIIILAAEDSKTS